MMKWFIVDEFVAYEATDEQATRFWNEHAYELHCSKMDGESMVQSFKSASGLITKLIRINASEAPKHISVKAFDKWESERFQEIEDGVCCLQ